MMGILSIALENETGLALREAQENTRALDSALTMIDPESFPLLGFVDPYGDTIFNVLQWPLLERELRALASVSTDRELHQLVNELSSMIANAEERSHEYLRFIGD